MKTNMLDYRLVRSLRVAEPEMHHRAVSVVLNFIRAMRMFRLV